MFLKRELYNVVYLLGYHIPPYKDPSITRKRLLMLLDRMYACPSRAAGTRKKLISNYSSKVIFGEIKRLYKGQKPLWFHTGRLPSREYLLSILVTLDKTNPVFGVTKIAHTRRRILIKDCNRCIRKAKTHNKQVKLANINREELYPRLSARLVNINPQLGLLETMKAIFTSRHNLLSLNPEVTLEQLREEGCDDITLQVILQNSVTRIDDLYDELLRLSK